MPIEKSSDQELTEIQAGPALFANKSFITLSAFGVRLTFAEIGVDRDHFRSAVFLPILEAQALRDGLIEALKTVEVVTAPVDKKE